VLLYDSVPGVVDGLQELPVDVDDTDARRESEPTDSDSSCTLGDHELSDT